MTEKFKPVALENCGFENLQNTNINGTFRVFGLSTLQSKEQNQTLLNLGVI